MARFLSFFTFKNTFSLVVFLVVSGISIYLSGIWLHVLEILKLLIFAGVVYAVATGIAYLRKAPRPLLWAFMARLAFFMSVVVAFAWGGLAIFCVYQNELAPATLPLVEVSSSGKTILFQNMSHIASPEFYASVKTNIENAKKAGFVLYYEGVRPGTEANTKRFYELLGTKLSSDTYDTFAKFAGLSAQDNKQFLNLVNNRDFNVDVGIDDIIHAYNERVSSTGSQTNTKQSAPDVEDIGAEIAKLQQELNPRELAVLRYIVRAAFSALLRSSTETASAIETLTGEPQILQTILDDRNENLARYIAHSEHARIFVIYGALHFNGTLAKLQELDSSFHIGNIVPIAAMAP